MDKVSEEELVVIQQLMSKYELSPVSSVEEDENGVVVLKSATGKPVMMMNRVDWIAICKYADKNK